MSPSAPRGRDVALVVWATGMLACAVLAAPAAAGVGVARASFAGLCMASLGHLALLLGPAALTRRQTLAMLGVAGVAHGLLLAAPPLFSGDIYRYALDGTLSTHGISPWSYAPASPKIADLAAPLLGHINHPELPTIYPPLAQLVFALGALTSYPVLAIRLLLAAIFAAGCAGFGRGTDDAGRSIHPGVALFTHPLAVVAISGDGHVDALAVPLVALALAAGAARPLRAGVALGLAASVKLFPLGLAAALAGSGLRRAVGAAAVAALVLAATYTPAASMGAKAFGSLGTYAATWRFNAGAESLAAGAIETTLRAAHVDDPVEVPWESRRRQTLNDPRWIDGVPWTTSWRSHAELARTATRGLAALAFALTALILWRRRAPLDVSASALTLVLFAGSPVVHPWYLLWLLPWAVSARDRVSLVLCATSVFAFHAAAAELDGLPWRDAPGWRVATWAPVAATLCVVRWRDAQARRKAPL